MPRLRTSRFAALCLGLLVTAACQADGVSVGERSAAIVNGEVSYGDDQVVALVYRGKQFCSGTIVGKRTVVTAAHCLPPHIEVPMSSIAVYIGTDLDSGEGTTIRVVDGLANPDWSLDAIGGDVGVVALAHDAPVAPMPMAYLDVSASGLVGSEVRAVGYGITEAEGEGGGQRRTGLLRLDRYSASSLYLNPGPSATCNGDSGGALLFVQDGVEVLGGIHSRSDCGSSIIAERVDVHTMDFIMPFLEEHEGAASCELDGMCATGCDAPDPDCLCAADGMCGDGCAHPSADLDCVADCPADGVCDESCSYDFDCQAEPEHVCPEGDESCGQVSEPGGCQAGGGSGGAFAWLVLGLALVLRRRRDCR